MYEGFKKPNEWTCWSDWAGPVKDAAIDPRGYELVEWANEVVPAFFTDEWLVNCIRKCTMPLMSIWNWPLSNPHALTRHIERAARIAILPEQPYRVLTEGVNAIRTSTSLADFAHLEVILEVIGIAQRDGWSAECEIASTDGHVPDLRLTRQGVHKVIEVTTQGTSREIQDEDRQSALVYDYQFELGQHHDVQYIVARRKILSKEELRELRTTMERLGEVVGSTADAQSENLGHSSIEVIPKKQWTGGTVSEGPVMTGDVWPRFAQRLHDKARQTCDAGKAWIRIDEYGMLLASMEMREVPFQDRLNLLSRLIQAELSDYSHVEGVILSNGTSFDWKPQEPDRSCFDPTSGSVVLDRRLPGQRRRHTFVVPLVKHQTLLLPDRLKLSPARWYSDESSWLEWALNKLGKPSINGLIEGELARWTLF